MSSQLSNAFAYSLKFPTDLELPTASLLVCRMLLEKAVLIESATNSCSFTLTKPSYSAQHFFYSSLADSFLIPHSSFSKYFQLSLRFKLCSRYGPKIPFQFHLSFLPKSPLPRAFQTPCICLSSYTFLCYLQWKCHLIYTDFPPLREIPICC